MSVDKLAVLIDCLHTNWFITDSLPPLDRSQSRGTSRAAINTSSCCCSWRAFRACACRASCKSCRCSSRDAASMCSGLSPLAASSGRMGATSSLQALPRIRGPHLRRVRRAGAGQENRSVPAAAKAAKNRPCPRSESLPACCAGLPLLRSRRRLPVC